eukprot:TRINITY_DN5812_c0_g2_i1.p1 TRINITY_DN5812_c0_g2~~TRINITY_DN5812_c0_g2_i1.p1  ORF type:complete len:297 (+),score=54.65 TRINITY_DN5812_c0_g2_i1:183-1073(+)
MALRFDAAWPSLWTEAKVSSVEVHELLPDELTAGGKPKSWRRAGLLASLDNPGDRIVVAEGGFGGKGNNMATPYEATPGTTGEERRIELEMKMIADVGLVGMPNAGKSTLLGAVSRASPKIAPYPFTTVAPYIGRAEFKDGSAFSIADVPGLVEGAHLGSGMGHEFLRHLERTRILLFVVDVARGEDPLAHFLSLRNEVALYSPEMAQKPCGIVANKCDLTAKEPLARADELYRSVIGEHSVLQEGENAPIFVRAVSARFGDGIPGLLKELLRLLQGQHPGWQPSSPAIADDDFID